MATRIGLFSKAKSSESFKPLKEILEQKKLKFPLLLMVKARDIVNKRQSVNDEEAVLLYIERRATLAFFRLKVVDIPNLEGQPGSEEQTRRRNFINHEFLIPSTCKRSVIPVIKTFKRKVFSSTKELPLPNPKYIDLLEDTHLSTLEKRKDDVFMDKGTRLEVVDVTNAGIKTHVVKDPTGRHFAIKEHMPIRFSAIPASQTCLLCNFKDVYDMPKVVRFEDITESDTVQNSQCDLEIMSDVFSGPVRILEETEFALLIAWIKDKYKKDKFRCLLIPESKTTEIMVKKFSTKSESLQEIGKFHGCSYNDLLSDRLYVKNLDGAKISYINVYLGEDTDSEASDCDDSDVETAMLLQQDNFYTCPNDVSDEDDSEELKGITDFDLYKKWTKADDVYTNFPSQSARGKKHDFATTQSTTETCPSCSTSKSTPSEDDGYTTARLAGRNYSSSTNGNCQCEDVVYTKARLAGVNY